MLTVEFADFFLVVVYVPNAGGGLTRLDYRVNSFDRDFQAYLNKLKESSALNSKSVIICGDLNVAHEEIDITNPHSNSGCPGFTDEERSSFSKFLKKTGWTDTFRHLYPRRVRYSWFSPRGNARAANVGWRIDYFLVDKEINACIKDSMINNDIYGSDHCPVEMILDLQALRAL